jgi:hypothetical protein
MDLGRTTPAVIVAPVLQGDPYRRLVTPPARERMTTMRTRDMLLVALILLVAVPALAQRPRTGPNVGRSASVYTAPPPYQLVLEGGAAIPFGDLGDDFEGTLKGLGAGTGYEIGGRFRYYANSTLAIGPSFHYADFGDWDGILDDEFGVAAYSVRTSSYRYGLDVQQFIGSDRAGPRFYVTIGAAVINNRYEDWVQDSGTFQTSSTNLAATAGAGLAIGPMELSAVWHYNPVDNRNLPRAGGVTDTSYDWSYLVVRAGIAFGGF